jgi:hypothetical protein
VSAAESRTLAWWKSFTGTSTAARTARSVPGHRWARRHGAAACPR